MGKIKATQPAQGSLVKSQEPPNYDDLPPIFSLEKLQTGKYCLSALDQAHKAMFAEAIFKRRQLSWKEMMQCNRHKLGSEKISLVSIKAGRPRCLTEDVTDVLALRYHGMNPMVGYRQRNIFFVLWFDHDFTLYDHS